MSKISLTPNASGTGNFTIASPNSSTDRTLTLPDSTGTVVVTSGAQTIEFADGSASAPSITNSGDTNTGMFFPAADTIAFAEGGTEAMRIDSSGNVGIGTSSTNAKLDVVGQILTGSNGNNAVAINSSGSNYGFISNPSNGVFALGYGATIGTLGTSVATWNSSGNFGFNSGYGSVATAYGCRAWVKFSGSTGSINGSGNVSSVSDNGTGNFTVNFSTAMPDANYAWNGTCDPTSAQTSDSAVKVVFGRPDTNPTTSAIALLTASSGAGRDDMESVFVTVFR